MGDIFDDDPEFDDADDDLKNMGRDEKWAYRKKFPILQVGGH